MTSDAKKEEASKDKNKTPTIAIQDGRLICVYCRRPRCQSKCPMQNQHLSISEVMARSLGLIKTVSLEEKKTWLEEIRRRT